MAVRPFLPGRYYYLKPKPNSELHPGLTPDDFEWAVGHYRPYQPFPGFDVSAWDMFWLVEDVAEAILIPTAEELKAQKDPNHARK